LPFTAFDNYDRFMTDLRHYNYLGFYDSDSMDEDDLDEDEWAAYANDALGKKKLSQLNKKARKNGAVLPRNGKTALSYEEMSEKITKAGFDPSKIQAKAKMLQAAVNEKRKRKREEEEDVDMAGPEGDDWMDVDGEDSPSASKRVKTPSGSVAAKRAPRTNRQLAGMRDQGQATKADQLRNLAQRPRNMHAKAGEADRAIRVKKVCFYHGFSLR
jgi:nucleolar GTP-binding protein